MPAAPRRHVPNRMCVACRQSGAKRDLVRVVRTGAGSAVVDATGKQNGRGAYVCLSPACVAAARKQRKLDRALKVDVPVETYADLEALAGRARIDGDQSGAA